jgi:molybdenum cofactor cytidylyltransferase
MHDDGKQFVGILLAAGCGTRFDASGAQNKLLQEIGNGDLVAVRAVGSLLAVLPTVVAVTRPRAGALAACLEDAGCTIAECATAGLGMGASLAFAIARTRHAAGWVIALADMPYLQTATIRAVVDALEHGADIAVPVRLGQRGNPVGFSCRHLAALLRTTGDQGARTLLRAHPVIEVEVGDDGIHRDIDTVFDLRRNIEVSREFPF